MPQMRRKKNMATQITWNIQQRKNISDLSSEEFQKLCGLGLG